MHLIQSLQYVNHGVLNVIYIDNVICTQFIEIIFQRMWCGTCNQNMHNKPHICDSNLPYATHKCQLNSLCRANRRFYLRNGDLPYKSFICLPKQSYGQEHISFIYVLWMSTKVLLHVTLDFIFQEEIIHTNIM